MNFIKKQIKKQIGFYLILLTGVLWVNSVQGRMHYSQRGGGKYLFLNLNHRHNAPYLTTRSFTGKLGGNFGYGQSLGSHGYYGFFETGIDSIGFSSLGLLLRYGFEFMRHTPFSIGLGFSVSPHYTLRQQRFDRQLFNNGRVFLPYSLELHGKFKITHHLSGVLRLGMGSVLFPVRRINQRIQWPLPMHFKAELGIRYYL